MSVVQGTTRRRGNFRLDGKWLPSLRVLAAASGRRFALAASAANGAAVRILDVNLKQADKPSRQQDHSRRRRGSMAHRPAMLRTSGRRSGRHFTK